MLISVVMMKENPQLCPHHSVILSRQATDKTPPPPNTAALLAAPHRLCPVSTGINSSQRQSSSSLLLHWLLSYIGSLLPRFVKYLQPSYMENLTHTDRGAVSSYSFQWIGNYEAEIPVFHAVKKVKLNEVEIPFYIFSLIIRFLFYFTFTYL